MQKNPLRQALRSTLDRLLPPRMFFVRGPRQLAADGRCPIALTFDDGPHPEHTPPLLDRLQEWGLKATFFVVGQFATQHPQLVKRAAAEGHEIGNHTETHSLPSRTSARQFLAEVRKTRHLLEDMTGQECRLVRPPRGQVTAAKLSGLWWAGQSVILWNVDPRDYRMTSEAEIEAWSRNYAPQPGDVVLMHDNLPLAERAVATMGEEGLFQRCQTVSISEWTAPGKHRPLPSRPLEQEVAPCR